MSLTTKLELIDDVSSKFSQMANAGKSAMEQIESATSSADDAFYSAALKTQELKAEMASAIRTSGDWTNAITRLRDENLIATVQASEAIYSTEELVQMGLKNASALEKETTAYQNCVGEMQEMNYMTSSATTLEQNLTKAITTAESQMAAYAESGNLSATAQENYNQALDESYDALEQLQKAQEAAEETVINATAVTENEKSSVDELNLASSEVHDKMIELAEANDAADTATANLSKSVEDAAEEMKDLENESEDAGNSTVEAITAISSALATVGIVKTVKEIAESVYELVDAFSEAESTIALATGATNENLDNLADSMLEVYSVSKTGSLEDTASAVGEINTRLSYTDEALEETTELFLDFADVTGGDASSAVRSVTQLMNQWNVDTADMESTLSKLVYAGQASGISVDSLTSQLTSNKAILDELGFSLDEATAMFMNMELAGTQTSQVMMGFRTALSSGAITSLEELYAVLDEAEQGLLSTEEAADMFGTRAGVAIVNAAQTGVFNIDEFVASLENADGTLETTAETAQTLSEKWEQATNNVGAAFTKAVEPTLSSLSSKFAEIANDIGDFLNEHPAVVKALTAIGVEIGVVTLGLSLMATMVTAKAIPAIKAAGVAVKEAFPQVAIITTVLAAVTAGVIALTSAMSDSEDEYEAVGAATYLQREELEELEAEYESVCETQGESSAAATELAYQIDEATAAYENSYETLEEYSERISSLRDDVENTASSYSDTKSSLEAEETAALNLTSQLEELANKTTRTAEETAELQGICDILSSQGFDIDYSDIISECTNLDEVIEKLKDDITSTFNTKSGTEALSAYSDAVVEYEQATSDLADANAAYSNAQEEFDKAYEEGLKKHMGRKRDWENSDEYQVLVDQLDGYEQAVIDATAAQDIASQTMERTEQDYLDAVGVTVECAEGNEELSEAISTVATEVQALCEDYNTAYDAALESVQGQYNLWDSVDKVVATSVSDMNAAMQSQIDYWTSYADNLNTLNDVDLGTDELNEQFNEFLKVIDDGSEESAAMIAGMANSVANGDTSGLISMMQKYEALQESQEKVAGSIANTESEFTEKMADMMDTIDEAVEGMGVSEQAKQKALDSMTAYATSIAENGEKAVDAATEVAKRLASALKVNGTITVTANGSSTPIEVDEANATGTLSSADTFIAGEEGPELIVGHQGSTVFPTSETDRIISAVQGEKYYSTGSDISTVNNDSSSSKTIDININGSGTISAGNGVSKEDVKSILVSEISDVIIDIIAEESQQEGVSVGVY